MKRPTLEEILTGTCSLFEETQEIENLDPKELFKMIFNTIGRDEKEEIATTIEFFTKQAFVPRIALANIKIPIGFYKQDIEPDSLYPNHYIVILPKSTILEILKSTGDLKNSSIHKLLTDFKSESNKSDEGLYAIIKEIYLENGEAVSISFAAIAEFSEGKINTRYDLEFTKEIDPINNKTWIDFWKYASEIYKSLLEMGLASYFYLGNDVGMLSIPLNKRKLKSYCEKSFS